MSDKNQLTAAEILDRVHHKTSGFWMKIREEQCLNLFHKAAEHVPAYKDYLQKNNINPTDINNWEDYQKVPPVSKKDYLRQYPLEQLCWNGTLSAPYVYTSTSGSTGEPFYFMRPVQLDWQYSVLLEDYLRSSLNEEKTPTLVIIGFGMGVWIGGLITYKGFEIASQRNKWPVSIITPGISKRDIFNTLRTLAPHYKQIVLVGYPPFVKDIIDEAPANNIDLKKYKVKVLFAAEAITEKFRDYLAAHAGLGNVLLDSMSIYGSADIGAMATENAISILIKRLALSNQELLSDLFNQISKTPTLAQFNPYFTNFEAPEGELYLTGDNAIPLIRYAIGDNGGVQSFDQVTDMLNKNGFNLNMEAEKAGIGDRKYQLPFVYVYERKDFMVKLNLHEIYPEMIRDTLISPEIQEYVTGKFNMSTCYDESQNQYLNLNLELKNGKTANPDIENMINDKILDSFKEAPGPGDIRDFLKIPRLVRISFWPAEDPTYFRPGVKQAWVVK